MSEIRWTDKIYLDSQGNIRTIDGCSTDQTTQDTINVDLHPIWRRQKMSDEKILNVKISKPRLYVEDHGCLTFDFLIEGSGFGCCFGGYCIGHPRTYSADGSGLEAMMRIMDVVGVNCWEDLDGKYCRIKDPGLGGVVTCIGNLIDDEWFDIYEFFEKYKSHKSKDQSEAEISQNIYNRMANRGATREELDTFRNLIHKYNATEVSVKETKND